MITDASDDPYKGDPMGISLAGEWGTPSRPAA